MSRERGGEAGKQGSDRETQKGACQKQKGRKRRFCFLLKSSSVKPELPFSKPKRVEDIRQATVSLTCSLSKA